jgi:hypothetical protein
VTHSNNQTVNLRLPLIKVLSKESMGFDSPASGKKMCMTITSPYVKLAFDLIKSVYGDNVAKRSQVPLIKHIIEGLYVLDALGSNDVTKAAYCLHPILQSDYDFVNYKSGFIPTALIDAAILAMEYRRVANSYLSKDNIENFVGFSCHEVKEMLIADKIQNYKDFLKYHKATHERSKELDEYFNNWFKLLQIDYEEMVLLILKHMIPQ